MKSVPFKYGLVIGIFSTAVYFILAAISKSIASGLLPYAVILGISFGLMMIYGITKKNELENHQTIAYHEAFISSFVIGFVGILIFFLGYNSIRGWVYPEIPEIQKAKTIEKYDNIIKYYKDEIEKEGSGAAEKMADYSKFRDEELKRNYNPVHSSNIGNTLISMIASAGLFSAVLSLISSLFGYRTKIIES